MLCRTTHGSGSPLLLTTPKSATLLLTDLDTPLLELYASDHCHFRNTWLSTFLPGSDHSLLSLNFVPLLVA